MVLRAYLFHLRARNLSPRTIKATEEYLRLFFAACDPLTADKRTIENYLAELSERCKPATVATAWRHIRGLYKWLEAEGDIAINPMALIRKPIVPPTQIRVLTHTQIRALLKTCSGTDAESRRDNAIISIMLDAGLRLTEVVNLTVEDLGEDDTLCIFGKGRKWRTAALGTTSATSLARWLRKRDPSQQRLWNGRKGSLTPSGLRKMLKRRGLQAGFHLHPHMLRHTFVDNWLRNGGAEVDLARLAGWTTTRMAERYAQHRADERAVTAHKVVAPLDSLT